MISNVCPHCGEATEPFDFGSFLLAECFNCGWRGTKTKKEN